MAFDRYGTPIRSAAREMEQRGKTPLVLYCTVLVGQSALWPFKLIVSARRSTAR